MLYEVTGKFEKPHGGEVYCECCSSHIGECDQVSTVDVQELVEAVWPDQALYIAQRKHDYDDETCEILNDFKVILAPADKESCFHGAEPLPALADLVTT